MKKRSMVILYCWAVKRGAAMLKGKNQCLPSNWWLVTSRAHKWSIVSPVLFNTFTERLDDETEYILSKSKGGTKFGRMADMLNDRASKQRNLRTESTETSSGSIRRSKVCTCNGMIPCSRTRWEVTGYESPAGKDLGKRTHQKHTSTWLSLHGKQLGCWLHQEKCGQ